MAKIKKRGATGAARNYITRTQAVKKLQISLPDFRKLCIWKGIYPREPRNKRKVTKSVTASTTFYYTKDIQYLLHEPLLQKFREQKVLEKKISKALGRGDNSDAARWERNAARPEATGKPRYTLNHVIRERYPTFIDAVRDLDDCLSMLFLFANLPSTSAVPARMIARCERLCLEFQHYLIVSNSLRKSFLSIKGIYYQANIQGEDVLWLVPYKFNQRIVGDVDFRIMGTFVEFYMTLLSFVNYRLFTSIGIKYPPKFDQLKDEQGAELGAFSLEGVNIATDGDEIKAITNGESQHGPDPKVQAAVDKIVEELKADSSVDKASTEVVAVADEEEGEQASDSLDKFEPAAPGGDVLPQPTQASGNVSQLFSKFTVYLSRETPRQPLEFLLRAFGCKRIGWDSVLGEGSFTTDESDPSITHQIVDRPVVQAVNGTEDNGEDNQTSQKITQNQRYPGRIYVQPQWVWDSVNDVELKSPELYAPGAGLPPHLSPFVKTANGQYDPTLPLDAQETEAEALDAEIESDAENANAEEQEQSDEDVENDMNVDSANGDESEVDAEEFAGVSDDDVEEDEEEAAILQRQREVEAELSGKSLKSKSVDAKSKSKLDQKKALEKKAREEAEDLERAKGMLSKKKRKLFEQMQFSNKKKSTEDTVLRAKRRKLEKEQRKARATLA
ncbi:Pescadillo N-terminus-domain-containing protein [Lasiosphaeris hirsuta]|uniref:Pescadillo homolog n=1 Tax=Lasiosphaeris hirsuta TaxID=260670 RepID=A0AA40E880_9PEZI|nr:Pescadillo N-terminus-domain-containing protein [Lasiosphaeris hirsuta]